MSLNIPPSIKNKVNLYKALSSILVLNSNIEKRFWADTIFPCNSKGEGAKPENCFSPKYLILYMLIFTNNSLHPEIHLVCVWI